MKQMLGAHPGKPATPFIAITTDLEKTCSSCKACWSPLAMPDSSAMPQYVCSANCPQAVDAGPHRHSWARLGKAMAKPQFLGREAAGRYGNNIYYSGEQPSLVKEDASLLSFIILMCESTPHS